MERARRPIWGDDPGIGIGEEPGQIVEKGVRSIGAPLESEHNHRVNSDDGVIERPNAERTTNVKVSNGDGARTLLLAEQKSCNQETADDKKDVYSPFALAKHRKGCQCGIERSAPPGMKPDHADDAECAEAIERAEESDLAEPGVTRTHQPLVGVPFWQDRSGCLDPDGLAGPWTRAKLQGLCFSWTAPRGFYQEVPF